MSARPPAKTGRGDHVAEQIYVQIPAYRDPELVPTVTDLLAKARNAERLTVCVAWQFASGEEGVGLTLRQLRGVQVLAIPAAESQGCNWARRLLQERWDGQEY